MAETGADGSGKPQPTHATIVPMLLPSRAIPSSRARNISVVCWNTLSVRDGSRTWVGPTSGDKAMSARTPVEDHCTHAWYLRYRGAVEVMACPHHHTHYSLVVHDTNNLQKLELAKSAPGHSFKRCIGCQDNMLRTSSAGNKPAAPNSHPQKSPS